MFPELYVPSQGGVPYMYLFKDDGATALIEAAFNNNDKVLQILLAAKANKEARNSVGVRS